MKPIEPDSLQRRLAYIKKAEATKARWNPGNGDTIQQALRRSEQYLWGAFIYFFGDLLRSGIKDFLEAESWWSVNRILPILGLTGLILFFYMIARIRWALAAFEQFGPQSASDLETLIARDN